MFGGARRLRTHDVELQRRIGGGVPVASGDGAGFAPIQACTVRTQDGMWWS